VFAQKMIEHGPFQNCIMFSDSKKENCAKTLSKTLILIDSDQPHALVLGIVMHCQGLAFELEAFHGWPLEGKESWHPIVMRTLDQLYVVLVSCSLSFDFFSQYHFFQTCVVQDFETSSFFHSKCCGSIRQWYGVLVELISQDLRSSQHSSN